MWRRVGKTGGVFRTIWRGVGQIGQVGRIGQAGLMGRDGGRKSNIEHRILNDEVRSFDSARGRIADCGLDSACANKLHTRHGCVMCWGKGGAMGSFCSRGLEIATHSTALRAGFLVMTKWGYSYLDVTGGQWCPRKGSGGLEAGKIRGG